MDFTGLPAQQNHPNVTAVKVFLYPSAPDTSVQVCCGFLLPIEKALDKSRDVYSSAQADVISLMVTTVHGLG